MRVTRQMSPTATSTTCPLRTHSLLTHCLLTADSLRTRVQMTAEMGGVAVIHVFDSGLRHLRHLLHPELVAADGLALDGNRQGVVA